MCFSLQLVHSNVLKIRDENNQEKILPYCVFQFIVEYHCCVKDFETDAFLIKPRKSPRKAKGTTHVVMNDDGQFLIHDIDLYNVWVKKGSNIRIPIIPDLWGDMPLVPDIYSILNQHQTNQTNSSPEQKNTN
jgi:hypothetical protein